MFCWPSNGQQPPRRVEAAPWPASGAPEHPLTWWALTTKKLALPTFLPANFWRAAHFCEHALTQKSLSSASRLLPVQFLQFKARAGCMLAVFKIVGGPLVRRASHCDVTLALNSDARRGCSLFATSRLLTGRFFFEVRRSCCHAVCDISSNFPAKVLRVTMTVTPFCSLRVCHSPHSERLSAHLALRRADFCGSEHAALNSTSVLMPPEKILPMQVTVTPL